DGGLTPNAVAQFIDEGALAGTEDQLVGHGEVPWLALLLAFGWLLLWCRLLRGCLLGLGWLLLRCRFLRCWLLGLGWLLLGCRFLRCCFLDLGRSLLGRASTLACASGSCFCFRWLCLGCGLLGFGGLLLW